MAHEELNKIFLSASIPGADRHPKYYSTADIIAIRDAVRALATVVIPHARLVWGGHPSITPLIRYVMDKMKSSVFEHVTLYQSLFYENIFPPDNAVFERIIKTPMVENSPQESLSLMRNRMMVENDFKAAIFIGGMDGIEIEYDLFRSYHPGALILPVASTGGGAKIVYDGIHPQPDFRLLNDYAYMSLFKDLLGKYLQG